MSKSKIENRKNLKLQTQILLCTLLLGAACSRISTETSTVGQPLVDDTELGEGVSFDVTSNSGTGFVCMNHTEHLTHPEIRSSLLIHQQQDEAAYNSPFHRAFWVNRRVDIPRLFTSLLESENGQDMLNFVHLNDVAEAHYDSIFSGYTGVVLSALVVIPSADLNAEAESTSPCVSFDGQAISPA